MLHSLLAIGHMRKEFFNQFDAGGGVPRDRREPYSPNRIIETANDLGVSLARRKEPIVREYLGIHNVFTDLRGAIMRAREELHLDTKLTIGVRELFQANYSHALGFISAIHMKVEEQLG